MAMVGIDPVNTPLSGAVSNTVRTSRSPLLVAMTAETVSIAVGSRLPAGANNRKITCSPTRIEVVGSTVTSCPALDWPESAGSASPLQSAGAKLVNAPAPGTT